MRFLIIAIVILFSSHAMAFCPFSSNLLNSMNEVIAVTMYENCATGMNDDESQVKLAKIYDKGTPSVPKNQDKAIYYYQLSADNGNAESQARLAQIFKEMDKDRDGRGKLKKYKESITENNYMSSYTQFQKKDHFKGEFVHPYVLLMLATERPENKWYYPTKVLNAPAYATTLLKSYKLDDNRKAELSREASKWKKRKLLEIARQILTKEEYATFEETLYPKNGQGDAFQRSQALNSFKEKVEEYKKQDEESAKTFY